MDAFGLGLVPVGNGYHSDSDSDSETDGYFGQPLVADLELPEARSGHVAVAFGNCVIVWGGYTDRVNFFYYRSSKQIIYANWLHTCLHKLQQCIPAYHTKLTQQS